MIRLADVKKYYGSGDNIIRAVDDISLEVDAGEFLMITGPSGSGKTTLLNLIGGMTRPDTGEVEINKKDLLSMSDKELSRFRAASIGFAFQFQSMLPYLSAIENIALPLMFTHGGEEVNAKSLLKKVGLADREDAYAHELSSGQQRRICIARALVNRPMLLLCDEPTGDLDPETENVIMEVISEANKEGATIFMTTHNPGLRGYASRSLRIEAGIMVDEKN